MSGNLRIQAVNAMVESESLSPHTTIFWDPVTNEGRVYFRCARYFRMTGTEDYFGAPADDGGVEISLNQLLPRNVTVTTPQGPVVVPAMLLMGAIKTLFDELYNEQRLIITLPQE
jgi:hypothetical protein